LGARERRVEWLALPKSVESGNLSFSKTGIRWMSVQLIRERGNEQIPCPGECKKFSKTPYPKNPQNLQKGLLSLLKVTRVAVLLELKGRPNLMKLKVRHLRGHHGGLSHIRAL
jgi:hypothetical protein